jgi:putative nucleotidyltransferase with HDIG domain
MIEKSSGKILLADDDAGVLDALSRALGSRGHEVVTARSGDEALTLFAASPPDMLLLDLDLPDKSGFEVLDSIRSREAGPSVPVLFLARDARQETILRGLETGSDVYVKKPFRAREVVARVESHLRRARTRRDVEERNAFLEGEVIVSRENLERLNWELKRQILSFKTLVGLSQDLNRSLDWAELTKLFLLTVVGQVGANAVALYYEESEISVDLRFEGCRGIREETCSSLGFRRDWGLAARMPESSEIFDLARPTRDRTVQRDAELLWKAGFRYACPIVVKGRLTGLLAAGGKIGGGEYSVADRLMLSSLCHLAATGLQNARLFRELQETYLSTVRALINTLEAKHPYTHGHTERVARYTAAIAHAMNLPEEERERILFGAVLHDIGKMGVQDEILDKPSSLSEDEWKVIRNHPIVGANIISRMKFLCGVADLVRYHHERLDGRGYPEGLEGEAIPLGARIIAVADAFDAITTGRSYKDAEGWGKALETLESKADTHFDREVVSHFARIIRSGVLKPRNHEGSGRQAAEPEKVPSTPEPSPTSTSRSPGGGDHSPSDDNAG